MSNTKVDKAKGKAKAAIGKATGNKKLEMTGKLDQAGASLRDAAANIKSKFSKK